MRFKKAVLTTPLAVLGRSRGGKLEGIRGRAESGMCCEVKGGPNVTMISKRESADVKK